MSGAPITVILPAALRSLFPGSPSQLTLSALSVDAVLDALNARWPGMRDRLCDSTPRIRRHINIFVNGERATLQTPVPAGGEVFIITAISGG